MRFPPVQEEEADATKMPRNRILSALLVLTLSLCSVSSAEARKWRWWHFYGFYKHGYSVRSGDYGRRSPAANVIEAVRPRTGGGFGTVADRLVRGCQQQAAELQSWPFDAITQIVSPDEDQRRALEELRVSVASAAERLATGCPRDEPAPPLARLGALEQAIDTATPIFAGVEPPLRAFYAALDDEQKARLLRDLALSRSQAREGDRPAQRWERHSRRRGSAADHVEANLWAGMCERLTAALRGWPIREIERGVRLSESQRVAFYELVSSSLKTADSLAKSCPPETALTAPVRMAVIRARLLAVREAAAAIRPALTQFYDALDEGQKVRFAGMR